MTASGDDPRDSRSPRNARWLRDVTDRVPTAWLPGIVTAVFLGAAAAFGGLEAVAAPPIATLQAGEEHREAFLADYLSRIEKAHPKMADGRVLLRFPRIFMVAVKA